MREKRQEWSDLERKKPNILCENTSEPSESFFECKHVRE